MDSRFDIKFTELAKQEGVELAAEGYGIRFAVSRSGCCAINVSLYPDAKKEGDTVIAVNVEEAEAIKIMVEKGNLSTIAKVCYEIGNRHAPLFRGEDEFTFLTPFNGPMLTMIDKIPGLSTDVVEEKFDFETRISTSVSSHTH